MERRGIARIVFRVAAAFCLLAAVGFLFLPEAWIAFLKFTIQYDIGPMRGHYGCSPQEDPCCQVGFNRTAFTGEWAYPDADVTCIYVPYPVKEAMALLAAAFLALAAIARIWEKREERKTQLS